MNVTDEPLIDDDEWDAQERGMRAPGERGVHGLEPATARYALVADALRSMPAATPPPDFAAAVAHRIGNRDAWFERLLWRTLLGVFAAALAVAAARYGARSWQALLHVLGDAASGWVLAGAAGLTLAGACRWLVELAQAPRAGTHAR